MKIFLALLFTLVFVGSLASSSFEASLEKLSDKLFTANCTVKYDEDIEPPATFTNWMDCAWPDMTNATKSIMAFTDKAKLAGCQVPADKMMVMLQNMLKEKNYSDSPLIKRFPKSPCGSCARKIRCCTGPKTTFLNQSYDSEACPSAPCMVDPLEASDWAYLHKKHPTWTTLNTADNCVFGDILNRLLVESKMMKALKPLFCQILGSPLPSFNCVMNPTAKKCMCCCAGFTPTLSSTGVMTCYKSTTPLGC